MDKGIIIAGNLIVDFVKNIDAYPEEGMLANVRSLSRSIGGCAGNTTIDLAKMASGVPLTCIGRVGDDENGRYIISLLDEQGVDTANISFSTGQATSFTDVMFNMGSKERTFFHGRGANAEFTISHINFDRLSASIFHIGYALLLDGFDKPDPVYGTVMARALATARAKGMNTSIDVVSETGDRFRDVVIPSLKYCDYAVMNEIEAGRITRIEPRDQSGKIDESRLRQICEKMLELGVGKLAVVHMPELGCAMDASGNYYAVGSCRLPEGYIKGTVGAGDAFCAGMLLAIYMEWDISKAIRFAHAAAACCLSAENSVDGMRPLPEIEQLMHQFTS